MDVDIAITGGGIGKNMTILLLGEMAPWTGRTMIIHEDQTPQNDIVKDMDKAPTALQIVHHKAGVLSQFRGLSPLHLANTPVEIQPHPIGIRLLKTIHDHETFQLLQYMATIACSGGTSIRLHNFLKLTETETDEGKVLIKV